MTESADNPFPRGAQWVRADFPDRDDVFVKVWMARLVAEGIRVALRC